MNKSTLSQRQKLRLSNIKFGSLAKKVTMEDKEFYIQMTSDKKDEQCDIFPQHSIHKVKISDNGMRQVIKRNVDFIPNEYPAKILTQFPKTKNCEYCYNDFQEETEFIKWDKTEGCVRCFERHFIPAVALEQYKEVLRKTLKGDK